jgi:type III secretion protein D
VTTHQSLVPEIELHVRSGGHGGVIERLAYGSYTIGRSHHADITLSDSALDELAARVDVDAAALRIESLGGDIVLDGTRVEPGTARIAEYPVDLVIGGVYLHWTTPARPRSGMRRIVRALAGASVLAIVVMIVAAMAAGSREPPLAKEIVAGACEPPCVGELPSSGREAQLVPTSLHPDGAGGLKSPSVVPGTSASAITGISIQAAAAALRQHLSAAGLTTIDVSTDSDAVVAKGSAAPAVMHAWYEAREWFDQAFGAAVVLTSQVETRPAPTVAAPLSVQSIWAGKVPYVIDQRGQKYFQGSLVNDGWSIERIEHGRITLRRNAQVFVLQL